MRPRPTETVGGSLEPEYGVAINGSIHSIHAALGEALETLEEVRGGLSKIPGGTEAVTSVVARFITPWETARASEGEILADPVGGVVVHESGLVLRKVYRAVIDVKGRVSPTAGDVTTFTAVRNVGETWERDGFTPLPPESRLVSAWKVAYEVQACKS